jgi:hypothetical protein
MAAHHIVYGQGCYCYGRYRYDLLADAPNYAMCKPGLLRPVTH